VRPSWKVSHCLHAVCAGSHDDCLDTNDLMLFPMSWCKIYGKLYYLYWLVLEDGVGMEKQLRVTSGCRAVELVDHSDFKLYCFEISCFIRACLLCKWILVQARHA
jgi:hypothetical protein